MRNETTSSFIGNLSVRQKLLCIALGFITAFIVILTYTIVSIQNQKSDGVVIDLAGRQRMLTQRYMKEALLPVQGIKVNYAATLDIFDNTLKALINGGPAVENLKTGRTVSLPQATIANAEKSFVEQKALSKQLRAETENLLFLPPNDSERPEKLKEVLAINIKLLVAANGLVKDFTAQSEAKIAAMINWEIIIGVIASLIGAVASLLFAQAISRPLNQCVKRAQSIAEGNLIHDKLHASSTDELGTLANAFNDMIDSLRDIAGQTRSVTEDLNSSSAEILATTKQQAAGAKEQAAAVQEITSTVEEINQSGIQVSEKARQVASTAQSITASGASGMQAVAETGKAMEAIREQAGTVAENVVMLSEKTQAIGEIITTVNDIAEQSNLVALNAAIEAADAGEEGRRFSVVANEIKNLADQAKEATSQVRVILEEIQKGINTSVMVTEEAVKRVELGREKTAVAEETMGKMAANIQESVGAFQQIVGATNQQQIGLEQVTQALHEIRQASQQTASSTGQLEEAAGNLTTLGRQLRNLVEKYKI